LTRSGETQEFPASSGQEAFFFLEAVAPGHAGHVKQTVVLHGSLDVDALLESLRHTTAHHEILRTSYSLREDGLKQIVWAQCEPSLMIADLRNVPAQRRQEALQRVFLFHAGASFRLDRPPLMRWLAAQLTDEEWFLSVCLHHSIADEWSFSVLAKELNSAYGAYVDGRTPEIFELPIQFADYACWQRDQIESGRWREKTLYWEQQLAGVRPLRLPMDHPERRARTYRAAVERFELGRALSSKLDTFCRQEAVTPFMALLAAWTVLLHRYSGQEDCAIGSLFANRERSETEPLIGLLVNSMVIRTNLSGKPSFREVVHRTRDALLGALANREVPFEWLVREIRPEREETEAPFYEALIQFRNIGEPALELPGLQCRHVELDLGATQFALSVTMFEGPEGFIASLRYALDLFEAETIRRILAQFPIVVEGLLERQERSIVEIQLLLPGDRERLLSAATARPRANPILRV